jgi:hypothetical protein
VARSVNAIPYAFTGFSSPIDMSTPTVTVWNTVNAGQAIPAKWRLTLGGAAVSNLASFVDLMSYQVNCGTGAGNVEAAIEEIAPGNSGLTYQGDGNFHFNWKTPKTYKSTCRAMFVKFADGSSSPVVYFKFK